MKKTVPESFTTTFEKVLSVTCDICGRTKGGEEPWAPPTSNEPLGSTEFVGNVQRVEMTYEYGVAAGETYSTITESFDVCPPCWLEKIHPLMHNNPSRRVSG